MKWTLSILAALFLVVPSLALAQEGPPVVEPLPEHKILASDAGAWDASIKSWMAGPGSEPMLSKGTETNEVMTGGLWILSKFETSFGPAKFEGHGLFGYDPVKKKYVGTWVDSMSPTLSVLEGSYDARSKTITYTGEGFDPEHKAKYKQRMVTTTQADGSRVFSLYIKFEGEPAEAKTMEITYTRKK
jgi:hypothetical protein